MRVRALVVGLFLIATTGSACAAGPYIGFAGGASLFHDADEKISGFTIDTAKYKTGYGFDAAAGYNFDPVRVEFEYGYRKAELDAVGDANLKVMSYMLNGYYDIKTSTVFTPYVGAGIGLLHGETTGDVEDTVFGYQVAVGTAIVLDKHVALDFSYKFQSAGSDFSKNGLSLEYMSSSFFGGVRFNF